MPQPDCTCTHEAAEHVQREPGWKSLRGACTVAVVALHIDAEGGVVTERVWCPCLVYEEDTADASA